jgi:hypothetical protein
MFRAQAPRLELLVGVGKINKRDRVTNHNKHDQMDLVKTKYEQEMLITLHEKKTKEITTVSLVI